MVNGVNTPSVVQFDGGISGSSPLVLLMAGWGVAIADVMADTASHPRCIIKEGKAAMKTSVTGSMALEQASATLAVSGK